MKCEAFIALLQGYTNEIRYIMVYGEETVYTMQFNDTTVDDTQWI